MPVETGIGSAVAVAGKDAWERIKVNLAAKMTPQAYQNWVMRTEMESQDNGCLRILVPDHVTKDFLEQEYSEEVRSCIRDLNLPIHDVIYLAASSRVSISENAAAEPSHTSNLVVLK